ncbi:hypothetical protein LUZ63_000922 [Rhynchospora breviuscula]|uniref:Disease resistance protein At4g27190-like leucine-rich repeats domain-containing protein n=1 Tax=Rhynchospora breviuscula TaxID=2022672 RepID=A0A9Q0HXD8_9POAL|nr:hypothetical protein LUZ63_000922 [Rhynchospora breviuscula]
MSFDRTIEALKSIENRQVDVLKEEILKSNLTIIWNLGIGKNSGMLGFLQRLTEKALNKIIDFDYIIHLPIPSILEDIYEWEQNDLKELNKKVLWAVANALNLMDEDNSQLQNLKVELEEEAYYTYRKVNEQKESELVNRLREKIYRTLNGKKYLLVTEELCLPVTDPRISWLMEGWLPGRFISKREWNSDCWWLITFPDRERYNKCKNQEGFLLDLSDLINRYGQVFSPLFLLNQEFSVVAKSISSKYCMEMTHIMNILWSCILYTNFLKPERDEPKELIQMWFAEGLLTRGIKLRHVESEFVREELNALISFGEESGDESQKKDDSSINNLQLFGLAEMILEVIASCSLVGPKLGKKSAISFPGLKILLGSLEKGHNKNLNSWSSGKVENIISDPMKWINKTWISMNVTPWESDNWVKWMLHPKSNNTTTFILRCLKPFETINELFCDMSYLRVLKLTGSSVEYLPRSLSSLTNLRLLFLHNCNNLKSLGTASSSTSSPISSLERLEVLDLVGVPVTVIPDDLGNKKHQIYFLRISNLKITCLPLSLFNDMSNLRELVLDGCKSITKLCPLASLTNLETLSLSNTKLVSLPPDTFEKMQNLRVLKLVDNPLLEMVPKSLSDAQMLEELELRYCSGLKAIDALPIENLKVFIFNHTHYDGDVGFWYDYYNHWIQSLPESLSKSYNLREVKISGCTYLKVININGNISIRSFSLSDSSITSLSLYGCRELVKVDLLELHELEELNLSGTGITEIPDIFHFSKLRQLDLRAVPYLRRAAWHKLDRFPEVFNLDQCDFTETAISGLDANGKIKQEKMSSENAGIVCICVRDSHLFLNLDHKHCTYLFDKGYLQSFYFSVASYEKEALGTSSSQTIQFKHFEWSCYKDAKLKALAPKTFLVKQPQCHRLVEIFPTKNYPHCLEGILEITESLSMKDNIHVSSVSDLNPRVSQLLTLHIEGCHKIKWLFIEKGTHFQKADFGSLKHLKLSYCLKLESLFPDNVLLQSLETLIITGCINLETVFYKSSYYDLDEDLVSKKELRENHLRSLHTMRFHCLPQLLHIHEEQRVGALLMPKWRTLYFRECWGLRQLPHLTRSCAHKVCVDGENKKCNTFKAQMDTEQLSHYEFKSQPLVSSLKDGVKNIIFLK